MLTQKDMRWLNIIAEHDYTTWGAVGSDDIAQEGAVAWWLASTKDQVSGSINFYKQASRWRMKNVVIRGSLTGSPTPHSCRNMAQPVASDSAVWSRLNSETLKNAELAYHKAEVQQIIKSLTPRQQEYVRLRFWAGYSTPMLNEHFGYVTSPLWTRIKNRLAPKLEHLRELANG